ncbi:MAG: head-tail connector protein [Tannerellaceae bacterium]|nr:head-tail connector protein [Tannerellaceae bacterium]
MAYVTVTQAKKHLQVEEVFLDDDAYIAELIDVSERAVEKHICHSLSSFVDADGKLEAPLRQAILIMVANFYTNREAVAFGVSTHEVPLSVHYLLSMYRDYEG